MSVLVTGSSGFIGTSLVEHLTENNAWKVAGFDLQKPREDLGIQTYRGDVKVMYDVAEVLRKAEPDVVVHLAAQARVEPSYQDPIDTYRTNVLGTVNLLDGCLRYRPDALFIYASSEIIYGEADRYPTRETDHFRPDSAYASSKVAGDVLVQNCHGLRTLVLRSGMGYGPRSPPEQVITKFMLKAMTGKPLLFPKGELVHPTRDVNYVGNFVEGVARAIGRRVSGVYNMGSGYEFSVLTLAEKVIETVGKGEIVFTDRFQYRAGEEGKRTWLDITKARRDFGYNPKVWLEEGLARTYAWLKDHKNYWRRT